MNEIRSIIWLFPVLFMLHDFEEIILVEAWRKRYKTKLEAQKSKRLVFAGCNRTPAFSVGVAIEFLILSFVSQISLWTESYGIWYGLFIAFTIHLVGHCVATLLYKYYVPGVVTSILFTPICVYLLYTVKPKLLLSTKDLLLYSICGIAIMLIMIFGLHKCMELFEKAIAKFEQQPSV